MHGTVAESLVVTGTWFTSRTLRFQVPLFGVRDHSQDIGPFIPKMLSVRTSRRCGDDPRRDESAY
jgi:hypothetical protein